MRGRTAAWIFACLLAVACGRQSAPPANTAAVVSATAAAPAAGAPAPPPAPSYLTPAQPTDIAGVTAQVAVLRQYEGVLHVGVMLHNPGDQRAHAAAPVYFKDFALIDAKANRRYSPVKDANGRYLAGPADSDQQGGRWDVQLAPHSDTLAWVLFDALPAGEVVRLEGPVVGGFDNLSIAETAPPAPGPVASSAYPLQAAVISADRAQGQLHVRVRLDNPGDANVANAVIGYADVYALDPAGKRSYPLLKDASGLYVASPLDDRVNGGRWPLYKVAPHGQQVLELTFQAPTDDVKAVDLVLPWFAPIEHVAIAGAGGAAPSGLAVAGGSTPLQRALADLNADVTPQQVKVDLNADVLFDFDKSDLKPAADADLAKLATVLQAYPGAGVKIDGYTDGKGTDAHNRPLSERRAGSVAAWLVAHAGASPAQITTRGWGAANPVAPNVNPDGSDNPAGRARNRRVEITIQKAG
ncbi:MAG TPA: OmpA family protein [Caulobacteraceae bacterium]|nr:OmpA family protein [Caulobacteraceae bacterium]